MNPYDVGRTPFDLRAISVWNAENERCRREYLNDGVLLDPSCPTCTESATCWRCREKARRYLRVATSELECAELLAVIERPSPAAATCGTASGYRAHGRRSEQPCESCRRAHLRACKVSRVRRAG